MRSFALIAPLVLVVSACGDDGGAGGGGGGAGAPTSASSSGGAGEGGAGGGDPCAGPCTEEIEGTICAEVDAAGCPADRVCGVGALDYAWSYLPPEDGTACSVDGLLCYYEDVVGDAGGFDGTRAICTDDATWTVTRGACDLDVTPIDACPDGPSCLYDVAPCPVLRRCGDDDFPPPEGAACDTLDQACVYARTPEGGEASTTATCTESGWSLDAGGGGAGGG